ncbi:hypothetical protein MRB53_009362 [Persea americana]|uniref:Uncharacterized protein n=1 Tax=Persea americana TaxID=3435 RepID=A0ACC2LNY8_PERAE|nr:hypothetical protein MRB53_009362 [Persea americana]
MDAYEATRIVFSRIQALDPENASKIMGLLLIQDHGDKEMIRLAFGPETLLHSLVIKARKDLGLLPTTTPSTPSTPPSPSPFLSSSKQQQQLQNSSAAASATSRLLGLGLQHSLTMPSHSSWGFSRNGTMDDLQTSDELISHPINGLNLGTSSSTTSSFYGGSDLIDEYQLQDQLSFLNEAASGSPNSIHSLPIGPPKNGDLFYEMDSRSPSSEGMIFPYGNWGGASVNGHRRSCSVADICLGSDPAGAGFGWKPCLYFARGYCKNGTSCRFLHGLPDPVGGNDAGAGAAAAAMGSVGKLDVVEQCQELLRSKSQRLMASASYPYSAGKCMNFLLQQQQNDTQRAAAAALMLGGGGDDSHKFGGRSRMERGEFVAPGGGMVNPGSRQIYLTFPADSTFREEDVSNYFSIYGPVQDVRIPYQQKRMFGFVTFVYPETVKLILAKGNPHFVCEARVLVKPYKEKGKVPDKYRKQQQGERGDFTSCTTPSSIDSRDAYDLQLGARMFYNSHDALLRKLEEQADLQQAIEMQGRRLMNLQLLDVKKRNLSSPLPSPSPCPSPSPDQLNHPIFDRSSPEVQPEDNSSSPAADHQLQLNQDPFGQADKESTGNTTAEESPKEDSNFQESSVLEHNLPDSPFASPTKGDSLSIFSDTASNNSLNTSLFPANSTLDMASFKSCFFQMPRFSSGHGAIGM